MQSMDEEPIDEPTGEMPPISPRRRRGALITGCAFIIVIVVFLVWFIIANRERAAEPPSIVGVEGDSWVGLSPWFASGYHSTHLSPKALPG